MPKTHFSQAHSRRHQLPRLGIGIVWTAVPWLCCPPPLLAAPVAQIAPDAPNELSFAAQQAKFIRLVIHASSANQPCVDELEVYGPDDGANLALAKDGAKATASSCLQGYAIHQIAHLNDGRYGNDHSWIAASTGKEWAQVELPKRTAVATVVFSRDRAGQYSDRVPTSVEVLLSDDGKAWRSVAKLEGVVAHVAPRVRGRHPQRVSWGQQHAKFVRLQILGTNSGDAPCLDEIELFGKEPDVNVALRESGAKASVSTCADGKADFLNDGEFGADRSWTAARKNRQWAQIELPKRLEVHTLIFSRDRYGRRDDSMPDCFEVRLSLDGKRWKTVAERGRGVVPAPPPPPTVGAGGEPLTDLAAPKKDELGFANLALGAKPAASSLLPGYPDKHRIEFLNDGTLGNGRSWISNGEPSWAEVDLGDTFWVYKVALGSDSSGAFTDRAATSFRVLAATKHSEDSTADTWKTVAGQRGGAPNHVRTELKFRPVRARWIRLAIDASNQSACRIDELEVYGQKAAIPLDKIGPVPDHPLPAARGSYENLLRASFLAEEYAWLKTFGRADMSARLVDYIRVQEYPRHVGDDLLPLPSLPSEPKLDGDLSDACWQQASRGVVRVASPVDFDRGPLVNHAVWAGWRGDDLLLAIETDRLLSGHIAVVSSGHWKGCGVVRYTDDGLVFSTYTADAQSVTLEESMPVEGTFNDDFTVCELRLPLSLFPGCREKGIRVGLGMGGRHTRAWGRAVAFEFSSLSVAETGPCVGGRFRVRLANSGGSVKVRGNAASMRGGIALSPGQVRTLQIPAARGPLGPEYELTLEEDGRDPYVLHLFRYDPTGRTLNLMAGLADRLEERGSSVSAERAQMRRLRERQATLLTATQPDLAAERKLLYDARLAKRQLLMRDPDLAPLHRVLYVKRQNFEPSHNYSVVLDSRGGPGGSIGIVDLPRVNGRLVPGEASDKRLFDAGNGIPRNPMAAFDCSRVYFGYAKAKGDYFHVYSMKPDGSNLKQLTDGPFHDYWPCPLPDGGLSFISSRCTARYLCWRPQASVLFRMNPDGSDIRPLSYANLTEWAPSVMTDGRLLWTRSEYQDKGADFAHTLWSIRPDGSHPENVFGNTIIQPNGYANGREVPGTDEVCCTLISHFGDLNGPIVLIDRDKGRMNSEAIKSLTPEVPWPGLWPTEECFRDPVPIARDYVLCAHAPQRRFQLYVIDRYGNREVLYADPSISVMCPTPFRRQAVPPSFPGEDKVDTVDRPGELFLTDVYQGISPPVERGQVKWLRVCQEVRAKLEQLPNGEYRKDHPSFQDWYATPVHLVSGPFGWPSYVAKASWGLVPVSEDGSARFTAPAGMVLYFEVLDENFNELQRMRSVVQLQPGEKRSCIGCHESRQMAPPTHTLPKSQALQERRMASWEGKPFSFEQVVQPVLDQHCIRCHDAKDPAGINLTGDLAPDKVPASYRTLISKGLVHHLDWRYNPGGCEKAEPLTFGTVRSKLWKVLDTGHNDVTLTEDETLRLKTWIDLNCPLWPDYLNRNERPGPALQVAQRP